MSDPMAGIARDRARDALMGQITDAESDFIAFPDMEKANKLAIWWSIYADMPSGYWGSPNTNRALERIDFYGNWSPDKHCEPPGVHTDGVVISLGPGTARISEQLSDELEQLIRAKLKGSVSNSVLKVKVELPQVERLTCINCPKMTVMCDSRTCNNYNEREYEHRQKRIEEGKKMHKFLQAKMSEVTKDGS